MRAGTFAGAGVGAVAGVGAACTGSDAAIAAAMDVIVRGLFWGDGGGGVGDGRGDEREVDDLEVCGGQQCNNGKRLQRRERKDATLKACPAFSGIVAWDGCAGRM
jgi:hypothetical protein